MANLPRYTEIDIAQGQVELLLETWGRTVDAMATLPPLDASTAIAEASSRGDDDARVATLLADFVREQRERQS